jgi:hypothetical protein
VRGLDHQEHNHGDLTARESPAPECNVAAMKRTVASGLTGALLAGQGPQDPQQRWALTLRALATMAYDLAIRRQNSR